jgi:hypothetical protein
VRAAIRNRAKLGRDDGQAVTEYAVAIAILATILAAAAATGVAQTIIDKVITAVGV